MKIHSDNLADILDALWKGLQEAPGDRASEYRLPMVATVGMDGAPQARTVVLRACHPQRRQLTFHTDKRSPKVAALRRDPRLQFLFWSRRDAVQIRVRCTAKLHVQDATAAEYWEWTTAVERREYAHGTAPGEAVLAPAEEEAAPRLTPDGQRAAQQNFCLVMCTVQAVDWLWLAPRGHRRAQFEWDKDGKLTSSWVQP